MGLILDLAVVALAVAVIGSLALLAWTLAVSAVRAVADGRAEVAAARRRVTEAEARLHGRRSTSVRGAGTAERANVRPLTETEPDR